MFIITKEIGRKNIFFIILYIKFSGINIIFFIIFTINTFIFITYLLTSNIYDIIPIPTPININKRICPLLNINIEYNKIIPVIIQKIISSIQVTKSLVLKLILKILKKSKTNTIIIPFITKIKNKYA